VVVVDAEFGHPRLAAIYDALDPDRRDLDLYLGLVEELGARRVLDVGCGTGTFALLLARRGLEVVGVDPAPASLAVARAKPDGPLVRWVTGDARAVTTRDRDVVTMTANVAQAIVDPDDWAGALRAVHQALRPAGTLVFETRDPAARVWEAWTREATQRTVVLSEVGEVTCWTQVTDAVPPLVRFRSTWRFAADGAVLTSTSTLRFRTRSEVESDLQAAGFVVADVLDAPDRPGREMVFVARRAAGPTPSSSSR
jgi:SAM-dependent methyltransferase